MGIKRVPIFDLDGTLIDSDDALIAPFLALGVPPEQLSFGHAVGPECDRLGIALGDYVGAYDTDAVQPFDGAAELVSQLGRWAVCSNKHQDSGHAELARLDWHPEVVMFADSFGGEAKQLGPVLEALGLTPDEVIFVGDTPHDALCADTVGCDFYWAGWNQRTAQAQAKTSQSSGKVLTSPLEVIALL